eukprot:7192240-Karenia_brevis.AAC.1
MPNQAQGRPMPWSGGAQGRSMSWPPWKGGKGNQNNWWPNYGYGKSKGKGKGMNSFETDPYGSWPQQNGQWEMPLFGLETDCNSKTPPSQSPRQQEEKEHASIKETRKRGRWRKSNRRNQQDERMSQDGCTRKDCGCREGRAKKT